MSRPTRLKNIANIYAKRWGNRSVKGEIVRVSWNERGWADAARGIASKGREAGVADGFFCNTRRWPGRGVDFRGMCRKLCAC